MAEITLYRRHAVASWYENFVEFDYEGLIERKGRGRKPRLSPEEEEPFKKRLDEIQDEKDGGRITAHEIKKLLADEFDCCYSYSGTYALLDRLNIVWISGRSIHPKNSQDAIEQFKVLFPDEIKKIKEKLDSNKIEQLKSISNPVALSNIKFFSNHCGVWSFDRNRCS